MLESARNRLLIALVVAVAVALVAVLSLGDGDDDAPATETPCIDCEPAEGETFEQTLARKHAPIVQLRNQTAACDKSGAGYAPLPVEIVIGNQEVNLRASNRSYSIVAPPVEAMVAAGPSGYLDLPGNPRRPGCLYEINGRRFGAGQPNIAYARVVREEDFDEELVLQYWFYYYFNDANNKHESDWEMIQIVFKATSAEEALEIEPDRVAYSQHSSGELTRWDDDKLEKVGNHPVVFVAVGSQANYFGPHLYIGRAEQGAGFGCDDASGPGTRIRLETRLMPSGPVEDDDAFGWLNFEGRWGELAGPEFDGPTGPNMKTQWLRPLTWEEEKLRSASVRVPSRDTIGPNGVDAFCSIVARGSDLLLPIYLQLGRLSLVIVGVVVLGLVSTLTRTRYIPIQARPLRGRRRIGQILISALEIYRRRLRLFLGIGLAFLPIALLVSVVHWLVLNVSPIDPVSSVPTANNIAQELVLAFALAQGQFGVAYAIVIAAATMALSAIERNEKVGVRDVYRRIRNQVLDISVPRLLAVAAVVALGFTIIGLPLALRLAVRWTFLEQAILLDHARRRDSFGMSSRTVAVDWWWTAAAVVSLAALGFFAAPALAIVILLLFHQVPLSYVNLLSSFIYVALVPYVAITLALVYFDLRARMAGTQ